MLGLCESYNTLRNALFRFFKSKIMKITFDGEIEYICRKVAMCEHWKNGHCRKNCDPLECSKAIQAVRKLNNRLVLGNNNSGRILFEERRVCHDFTAVLLNMDYSLKKLQGISDALDDLNRELNDEEKVWAEELADRKRLGLEGRAAIAHYNEWMDKHGMGHLKVPYLS